MPTPDEYRKIAETYYRLAREAKTEADRLESALERRRNWRARAAHLAGYGGRWSLRNKRVSS